MLATTDTDLETVYRIRYSCYRRQGSIAASDTERFSDRYDDLPNQFSFLMRTDAGEPCATVRISVVRQDLGWNMAPSTAVFGDHPDLRTMAEQSFVEASRLCTLQTARRESLYRLMANLAAMADVYAVRWVVACPRPEHAPIYRRVFGFFAIAPARPYYGVSFETELLATPVEALRKQAGRVPEMRAAWQSAAALLKRGMPYAAGPPAEHGSTATPYTIPPMWTACAI